jgi:hypothetical protein
MTHVGPSPTPSAAVVSFVEWSAVLAGAALAVALSFVLLTFGAAIGLSATSPWPGSGLSVKLIASLAIFWAMIQQIGAFMAGGYIAGRMRSRWGEVNADEIEFRDGLHGGLVWAIGVIVGAALFFSTAGAVAKAGAQLAGQTAVAAGASSSDPMGAVIDTMMRPTVTAQATAPASTPPSGAPAATPPAAPRTAAAANREDSRTEIARMLTTAAASSTPMTAQDRAYLAQMVAQRAGLSQQEAERRVDQAITSAKESADKARRGAVLTGFVTAASLIVSFGAAWWAALKGGQHRDNSVAARFTFATRRRAVAPN